MTNFRLIQVDKLTVTRGADPDRAKPQKKSIRILRPSPGRLRRPTSPRGRGKRRHTQLWISFLH